MRKIMSALLVIVGLIHLLPVTGVLSAQRLSLLYGLAFDDPNVAILMRHRAVLFGLLGGFLLYAAFRPGAQLAALMAGMASVVSFLWLAWSVGGYNALIGRVVLVDWVALGCLLAAAGIFMFDARKNK